jgi:hypothetical protein
VQHFFQLQIGTIKALVEFNGPMELFAFLKIHKAAGLFHCGRKGLDHKNMKACIHTVSPHSGMEVIRHHDNGTGRFLDMVKGFQVISGSGSGFVLWKESDVETRSHAGIERIQSFSTLHDTIVPITHQINTAERKSLSRQLAHGGQDGSKVIGTSPAHIHSRAYDDKINFHERKGSIYSR